MTITRVGSGVANATTVSIPAHQAGDLIVMTATKSNSGTINPYPSGWQHCLKISGTNCAAVVSYKIAGSSGETSGTWSNAKTLIPVVYRSSKVLTLGNPRSNSGTVAASGNVAYSTLLDQSLVADKWIAACAVHRQVDTDIEVAPSGLTNVISSTGVVNVDGESVYHDSNGYLETWEGASTTLSSGTSGAYALITFEICETSMDVASGGAVILSGQSQLGVGVF